MTRTLYFVNQSTLVTDAEVRRIAAAINVQIRDHVAPAWSMRRVLVKFHDGGLAALQKSAPTGTWIIAMLDDPGESGALGWHSQDDHDHVYGEVFAKPSFDAGSTALRGPDAVSATASHEAIETFGDPFCNLWSDTGKGYVVATELCDPVENDLYRISGVPVSNFVLPAWFDAASSAGPWDYLKKCHRPFSMTAGGYWVQMKTATQRQKFARTRAWLVDQGFDIRGRGAEIVFSSEVPEWRRDFKTKHGRNAAKRLA